MSAEYYQALHVIWESSVRASHGFLSEKDIEELRPVVLEAFAALRLDAQGKAFPLLHMAGKLI